MFSAVVEAKARRRDNNGLNEGETIQFAYSPHYNTVGCRWDPATPFKVFNINYPLYRRCEIVDDWVALEPCTPKKPRRRKK